MRPEGSYWGEISFLAGIKHVIFTVIFQWKGLIFIEHNINCGIGMSNIAVGVSYCTSTPAQATSAMFRKLNLFGDNNACTVPNSISGHLTKETSKIDALLDAQDNQDPLEAEDEPKDYSNT